MPHSSFQLREELCLFQSSPNDFPLTFPRIRKFCAKKSQILRKKNVRKGQKQPVAVTRKAI